MTELLFEQKCVACRADAPRATSAEQAAHMQQLPDWKVLERAGVGQLERMFKFANFVQSLEFTNRVGALAEEHGHHPALLTEWGRVTVTWWTHKIGGLHNNDFVMAAKTDRLYSGAGQPGT